jgi:hypothetical protein
MNGSHVAIRGVLQEVSQPCGKVAVGKEAAARGAGVVPNGVFPRQTHLGFARPAGKGEEPRSIDDALLLGYRGREDLGRKGADNQSREVALLFDDTQRLSRVGRAEEALRALGFGQCRVRDYETLARIEVPADLLDRAVAARQDIISALKALGHIYITLDLAGLRSGSMNEVLR